MNERWGDLVSRVWQISEGPLAIQSAAQGQLGRLSLFKGALYFRGLYGGVRVTWTLNVLICKKKSSHFRCLLTCRVQVDGDFGQRPRVRQGGQAV